MVKITLGHTLEELRDCTQKLLERDFKGKVMSRSQYDEQSQAILNDMLPDEFRAMPECVQVKVNDEWVNVLMHTFSGFGRNLNSEEIEFTSFHVSITSEIDFVTDCRSDIPLFKLIQIIERRNYHV